MLFLWMTGSSLRRYSQTHQKVDLGLRAPPVLQRKRVQRQRLDLQPGAGLDHLAGGLYAGAVPGHPRQVAPLRPAAVAVHDDGDMLREAPRVELLEEARLLAACRLEQVRRLHVPNPEQFFGRRGICCPGIFTPQS